MNKTGNKKMFALLVILLVILLGLFVYFIYSYQRMDKNVYRVETGSVLYTNTLEVVKVAGRGKIEGKLDGNYYLYDVVGTKTNKYKIGKNAVVFNESDSYIYLYGDAYQILKTGDVEKLSGESKISKNNPTKIFKLADRKYLFVDSSITSGDDKIVDTKNYLYIEIDKNGNATFANNKVNFKTINPIVINGTYFTFDIANEKLTYDKNTIDLKNVIGSSNVYVKKNSKVIVDSEVDLDEDEESEDKDKDKTKKKNGGGGGLDQDVVQLDYDYYDDYLNSIITSVNNLVISLRNTNDTSKKLISQKTVYYDFNKWVALKSVTSTSSSIELSYSVFDPNTEYDVVFATLVDPDGNEKKYSLNKNNTSYTIRNLKSNTEYNIKFGYKTNSSNKDEYVDDVVISTTAADYELKVNKISTKEIVGSVPASTKTSVYYTLKVDKNIKFKSASVTFTSDGRELARQNLKNEIEGNSVTSVNGDLISKDGIYNGVITLEENASLGYENLLKLEDIMVCNSEDINSCSYTTDFDVSFKFYSE